MIGLGSNDANARIYGFAYWDGDVADNQFSEMTFVSRGDNTRVGVAIRVSAFGSPDCATLYAAIFDGGIKLVKYVDQSLMDLGTIIGTSKATLVPGDRLKVVAAWDILYVLKNGRFVIGPVMDKSIASGKIGKVWFGSSFWNEWTGGPCINGMGQLVFVPAQISIQ